MTTDEAQMTPQQHARRIAGMLRGAAQEAQADIQRVDEPKAQALFETVREVVEGAIKALEDFSEKREEVWR